MKHLSLYEWICVGLLIVGGLDLGIFGLLGFDLITGIFGNLIGRLIFIVMGAAAGYLCYLIYLAKFKKAAE